MNKLTKREILLINFLLLIAVVGAGYFMWIAPLTLEIDNLKKEKETLVLEDTKIDYLLTNKDSIDSKYRDAKSEYEKLSLEFTKDVSNLDIITKINESGLKLISLTRSDTVINKIPVRNAETTLYDYDLNNLVNIIEQIDPKEIISLESESDFAYQEITINVEGSLAQGEALVHALNTKTKTGYVTLFSRNDKNLMTVTLGVYSLQPSQLDY